MAKLVFFMKIVFRKTKLYMLDETFEQYCFFVLESVSHIMSDSKLNTALNH